MEYTKGEWKITKYGYYEITEGEYREYTYHIGGEKLANVAVAHNGYDALLIAAAPDMYEACKELIDFYVTPKGETGRSYLADIVRQTQKALAKANGE